MSSSIFLSHSSKDKTFARRLAADLTAYGLRVWIDEAEMQVGDSLIGRLEDAIDEMEYLAVILSPHSVESEWVLKEVRMAMHREIAGKKVVVLPLLYQDCVLPGFLRDKIYVDFRNADDYEQGVQAIVKRAGGDRFSSPALQEALKGFEQYDFQRKWRAALRTGVLSKPLIDFFKNSFDSAYEDIEVFVPMSTSYVFFLTILVEQGPLECDAWEFCCKIIEDPGFNIGIRYITLDRVLTAAIPLLQDGRGTFPDIDCNPDPFFGHTLLYEALWNLVEPSRFKGYATDSGTPVRILSNYWRFGDKQTRRHFLLRLPEILKTFCGDHTPDVSLFLSAINTEDSCGIDELLQRLRSTYSKEKEASDLLQRLLLDERPPDVEDILMMLRRASELEETDQDILQHALREIFSRKYTKRLMARRGDKFVYNLLVAALSDRYISISLASEAFGELCTQFGVEALTLDERISQALLLIRQKGKDRLCLMEAYCEGVSIFEKDDWKDVETFIHSVMLLIEAASMIADPHKKDLMAILKKYTTTSPSLALVQSFLEERIDLLQLSAELIRLKTHEPHQSEKDER